MTVDDDIERRAELWANGATIHNINNLLGCRRSCVAALKRDTCGDVWRQHLKEMVICVDKTLEQYMGHGDYERARSDNPLPPTPPRPERGT